jgi:hypothetical protein
MEPGESDMIRNCNVLQFGGLETLSLVRISRVNWIGHLNRMDSNSNVLQFGGLETLSLVRISRVNWIGHLNRMDSNSK